MPPPRPLATKIYSAFKKTYCITPNVRGHEQLRPAKVRPSKNVASTIIRPLSKFEKSYRKKWPRLLKQLEDFLSACHLMFLVFNFWFVTSTELLLVVRISSEESKWPQAKKLLTFLQQQGPPKCKRQVEGWVSSDNGQNIVGAASDILGVPSQTTAFSNSSVLLTEHSNL